MRNTIEMLFGAGVATGTRLEWIKVGSSAAHGGCDTYVDTTTIRREGESAKMWHLHDFKTAQVSMGKSYWSSKNWVEYDFRHAQRRTLYFSWNAEPMGAGDTVYRLDEPSAWRPLLPDSIAEMLSRIAAGEQIVLGA